MNNHDTEPPTPFRYHTWAIKESNADIEFTISKHKAREIKKRMMKLLTPSNEAKTMTIVIDGRIVKFILGEESK